MTGSLRWTFESSGGGILTAKSEKSDRVYHLSQNVDGTFAMYFTYFHERRGTPQAYGYGVEYASLGHALFAAEHFEVTAKSE